MANSTVEKLLLSKMKRFFYLFITIVYCIPFDSMGQAITWDMEDVDSTVVAGTSVHLYAHLQKSDELVYSCAARVTNVNLPAGWSFTLCNPFICLNNDISETNFTYPDTVNYDFDNEGHGLEAIKVTVHTISGNTALTGELDLTFENLTTSDLLTNHIIVRTNGQSVWLEEKNQQDNNLVFPNPADDVLQISDCLEGTTFCILDLSGREILNGITNGTINCSQLNQGNYFLQIEQNGRELSFLFSKK